MPCAFVNKQPSTNRFLMSSDKSVERATPGEEIPGSIPAVAAHSLLVGSVLV